MLKPVSHHRPSPVSSPLFHYAQAHSLPSSPLFRRNSSTNSRGFQPRPRSPKRVQYVDASTQWISPVMNSQADALSKEPLSSEVEGPPQDSTVAAVSTPAVEAILPTIPPEPTLKAESPGMKRRQSKEAVPSAATPLPPKRHRPDQTAVKILPAKYEFCEVEDIVVLIANMVQELIQTNDELPLRSGVLTRFHSRTPPGISVLDYLQRLAKHATLTPPLLLSMVYYIDRLCLLYPAFTINTLTVHRFLITAATVAAKGLSDSFWNNATYARVGGIKIAELGLLELDFLYRVDWKIVPNPEALVDYYRGLVERSEGYEIETETSSIEEDEDESEELVTPIDPAEEKPDSQGTTDSKWKAWMEDVSTSNGEGPHQDKPA